MAFIGIYYIFFSRNCS